MSNSEVTLSGYRETIESGCAHSSTMATVTTVQKMDAELRCPACRRYFLCPVLLPCGHSLCTSCAASTLLPSTEPHIATAIQSTLSSLQSDQYSGSTGAPYSSSLSSASGSSTSCSGQSTSVGASTQTHMNHPHINQGGSVNSDSDQVSVLSEADSGVVVTSRPPSYIGRLPLLVCHNLPANVSSCLNHSMITHGLICPSCNRIVGLFDEKGIGHLQKNRALERIIHKFVSPELLQQNILSPNVTESDTLLPLLPVTDPLNRPGGILCQLCEEPEQTGCVATCWCEQCEIFYCTACREKCHPSRGPLLRHFLHSATKGAEIVRQKRSNQPAPCPEHPHTAVNLFCLNCCVPICHECLTTEGSLTQENHGKHEIHPLLFVCKTKKTELSQALQTLSEKARAGTEYIQNLRSKSEDIRHTFHEIQDVVLSQLDLLVAAVEKKKSEMTNFIRETREKSLRELKDQVVQMTGMVTKSTGLIQFCIEMLKESDSAAFLLVCPTLISRAQDTEQQFVQELNQVAVVTTPTDSSLKCSWIVATDKPNIAVSSHGPIPHTINDNSRCEISTANIEAIKSGIESLTLYQNSGKQIPGIEMTEFVHPKLETPDSPAFVAEECIAERNVFTLVWRPRSEVRVQRYTLELDDGANGNFRKVYRGAQTICTVEGLHFRSVYRARIKAQNDAGESEYSEIICLQTSDLTWFNLDGITAPPEILLTNGNRTITSQIAEDRVVLGSTGLSRGVHYWEFTVDRCDSGGQPAFGIARIDCNKQTMLGLDMRSWSVYFDYKRSWFLHNGEHFERTDGGVRAGAVVGVRFDCGRGSLSFYLNDEPHGPIAFTNLPSGVYYPAVSLTRFIQLTLHSGVEPPSESEESDEDSSGGGTGTETTSMATTVLGQAVTIPSSTLQTFGPRQ